MPVGQEVTATIRKGADAAAWDPAPAASPETASAASAGLGDLGLGGLGSGGLGGGRLRGERLRGERPGGGLGPLSRRRLGARLGPGGGRRRLRLIAADQGGHPARVVGRPQRAGELGAHQPARQAGQDGQVIAVRAGRGGDQEDQVGRPVRGAEVDARGAAPEGQRRLGDVLAAAVGYADAAVEPGRHLRLTGRHVGEEAVEVRDAAGRDHAFGERPGGRFLGVGGQVQVDQVRGDQLTHLAAPLRAVPPWGRRAGGVGTGGWEGVGLVTRAP